jgi:hypothetical protein
MSAGLSRLDASGRADDNKLWVCVLTQIRVWERDDNESWVWIVMIIMITMKMIISTQAHRIG